MHWLARVFPSLGVEIMFYGADVNHARSFSLRNNLAADSDNSLQHCVNAPRQRGTNNYPSRLSLFSESTAAPRTSATPDWVARLVKGFR